MASSPARGGEMVPLLNEITLRKGKLDQFRAIIDEGVECWDDEMAAGLETLCAARRHPATE